MIIPTRGSGLTTRQAQSALVHTKAPRRDPSYTPRQLDITILITARPYAVGAPKVCTSVYTTCLGTQSRPSSLNSLSVLISDCCNTACDNCRKAKCKCEPGENTGEGCRNCELLGLGTASCGGAHRKADRSLSSLHFSRYTFPPCLQTLR